MLGRFQNKTNGRNFKNTFKHTRGRDPGYGGGGSKSMPFVVPSPDAGSRDS